MAQEFVVPHSLDDYFKSTPIGSLDKALGNNLYGINHRQVPNAVPQNRDSYGLAFFVRPQLNMQTDNIRNVRLFASLLTSSNLTIQRYIRTLLDPRLVQGYSYPGGRVAPIDCPLMDNQNAFFSVLTNNITSMSGWPDTTAPTFTSEPGLYREAWSIVDGISRNFESFDMEVTFRNTKGDPILYMFYIWLHYMSFVFEGQLVPYLDMITENVIDYNTRIYRLVLDKNRHTVTKIAATGAAFPISVATGSFFDFSSEKPYNDQNKDIPVRFRCLGAIYQDDILIRQFNDTVCIFNPSMRDEFRENAYEKIPVALLQIFNNRGYPRINPDNNVLEWWVPKDLFNNRTASFLQNNLSVASELDDEPLEDPPEGDE
jgi:hypothetical protein